MVEYQRNGSLERQTRIVDADWTPEVNILLIRCRCGVTAKHRADRWIFRCPSCFHEESLEVIRNR